MAEKETMQSIDKLFKLLEYMAANEPMGARELNKALGLSTTSIHRMLTTLVALGYVQQNAETEKYILTYKLAALGNQIMEKNDVVKIVHPVLKELSARCGETVHFMEWVGSEVRYIDKVLSSRSMFSMQSYIGLTLPIASTVVGKAILSELPTEKVMEIWNQAEMVRYTKNTIMDLDSLLNELNEIKSTGLAFDNEEREMGLFCIGSSISAFDGTPRYGVSISGPINRIKGENFKANCDLLLKAKRELSAIIGRG